MDNRSSPSGALLSWETEVIDDSQWWFNEGIATTSEQPNNEAGPSVHQAQARLSGLLIPEYYQDIANGMDQEGADELNLPQPNAGTFGEQAIIPQDWTYSQDYYSNGQNSNFDPDFITGSSYLMTEDSIEDIGSLTTFNHHSIELGQPDPSFEGAMPEEENPLKDPWESTSEQEMSEAEADAPAHISEHSADAHEPGNSRKARSVEKGEMYSERAVSPPTNEAEGHRPKRIRYTGKPSAIVEDHTYGFDRSKGKCLNFSVGRREASTNRSDRKRRMKTSTRESSEPFSKLRAKDVCIRCKREKRKCTGSKASCDLCEKRSLPCIRGPDLFQNLIPDVYTDMTFPKKWNVQLFVCFRSVELGPPLPCKVYVHGTARSDVDSIELNRPRIWEHRIWQDMRRGDTRKQCVQWDRLVFCSFPDGSMPKTEDLQQWALKSMRFFPSGAVGQFHGPMIEFAALYMQSGNRPLCELVELAVLHVSVYNICHGQLALVFRKRPKAQFPVSSGLRAQICGQLFPIFESTGIKLQNMLQKATCRRGGPPLEQHLAVCISMWLLMLAYDHCLGQANGTAELFAEVDPLHSNSIAARRERLRGLTHTIRKSYKSTFLKRLGQDNPNEATDEGWRELQNKTDGDDVCPVFNDALLSLCKIDVDDTDILEALSKLRASMQDYRDFYQDPDGLQGSRSQHLERAELIGPSPKATDGLNIAGQTGLGAPPPSEHTLTEGQKLDFDTMSMDTRPSRGIREPV